MSVASERSKKAWRTRKRMAASVRRSQLLGRAVRFVDRHGLEDPQLVEDLFEVLMEVDREARR